MRATSILRLLFLQKAVFVHQRFEFGGEGGVGGFEGGEVGLRDGLFQGVADLIPACAAFVEQVFVADFAFDVGSVEGLPQFQAFVIHGSGFFGELFAVQVVAHEVRLESAVETHLRFVVCGEVVIFALG